MLSLHTPRRKAISRAGRLARCAARLLPHRLVLLALMAAPTAWGKLPPPSAQEQASTAQAAARRATQQQLNAYRLCLRQDEIAAAYGAHAGARQRDARPQRVSVPPCKPPVGTAGAPARSHR